MRWGLCLELPIKKIVLIINSFKKCIVIALLQNVLLKIQLTPTYINPKHTNRNG